MMNPCRSPRFHCAAVGQTSGTPSTPGRSLCVLPSQARRWYFHPCRQRQLHAGELTPPATLTAASFEIVLSFARSQYDTICADLASSLDPFTIQVLQEARRIFLVTTPELVSLHMAADRLKHFKDLGLADKVSLLLNRKNQWHHGLSEGEAAQLVESRSRSSSPTIMRPSKEQFSAASRYLIDPVWAKASWLWLSRSRPPRPHVRRCPSAIASSWSSSTCHRRRIKKRSGRTNQPQSALSLFVPSGT